MVEGALQGTEAKGQSYVEAWPQADGAKGGTAKEPSCVAGIHRQAAPWLEQQCAGVDREVEDCGQGVLRLVVREGAKGVRGAGGGGE